MDEAFDASFTGSTCDSARAVCMNGVESLAPGRGQNSNGVDNGCSAFDRAGNRLRIAQVGLNRVDLPNTAHGLQITRKVRAADSRAHAPTPLCQR